MKVIARREFRTYFPQFQPPKKPDGEGNDSEEEDEPEIDEEAWKLQIKALYEELIVPALKPKYLRAVRYIHYPICVIAPWRVFIIVSTRPRHATIRKGCSSAIQ